jgi:ABC-type Fe3+-siderophore transport system permease subunit
MSYILIRLLCVFLCGVLVSQCGSLIQMKTRNILASPSTLGLDGLAVLWILLLHSGSIFLGMGPSWGIVSGIVFFVLIGLIFIRVLNHRTKFERLILLGLTFNLAIGALFSLWQFLFLAFNLPFPVELWFGHFRFAELNSLWILISLEIIFASALIIIWNDLLLYSLGRGLAKLTAAKEKRIFSILFILISVSTYLVIQLFGAFSFLGLIFPILARRFWFSSRDLQGELFMGSVMNGLIFMLLDFCCYHFPIYGAEIPVGLVVTGVGAVSLSLILWKSSDREFLAKPKK